jgi:pimeloyl-ACP methyl ester carboxylesterase
MAMPSYPGPQIRSRRVYALAAVLTATAFAASAPADASDHGTHSAGAGPKPTVVLVHGAFADASSWNGVAQRLQRDGYRVIAPANPLRDLPGDSAYIAGVLKSIKGSVILAGHSYGGAVISSAATGNPNVKALVYVSALAPDKGEVLSTLSAKFPGSELNPALMSVPFTKADGTTGTDLYIKPDSIRAVFAADLSATTTAVMAATQRPISASAFADKAASAAWKTIPSWFLVATQDRTIAPDLERFEAKRAGSHTIEVNSSHVAMISHPEAVTELILDAARTTRASSAPTLAATGSTAPLLAGVAVGTLLTGLVLAARKRRSLAH